MGMSLESILAIVTDAHGDKTAADAVGKATRAAAELIRPWDPEQFPLEVMKEYYDYSGEGLRDQLVIT
ncbi:hypothetical protein HYU40_03100 [Candidatus Woesearchaeota archaeon]|nr:hypothetical protein [Candidatus Woesearchaeota archaeon]